MMRRFVVVRVEILSAQMAPGPGTSIAAMENGITSNAERPGHRRPNLSPPDQMKGAVSCEPLKVRVLIHHVPFHDADAKSTLD
jgi:hypothetical protein